MKILKAITQIFFPDGVKCIVCGYEVFEDGKYLCRDCKLQTNDNYCMACGRAIMDEADFCDDCRQKSFDFTSARSPLVYKDDVKRIIRRLKYGNARYLAEIFGKILFESYLTQKWKTDVVTFVPMHKKRLKQRGYNQARLIAESFCRLSGLPLKDYLSRTVYRKNLARMSREQRKTAIKGTIELNSGEKPEPAILLIDDVFTTGTTANECARILKKGGALAVHVLTVATSSVEPSLY